MSRAQEKQKKGGLIGLVHKLPKAVQRCLLGIGILQRSQTYITKLPNMRPMLDKSGHLSPELLADLKNRGLDGAESVFINMGGIILHALYYPPKNGRLICAFHGIKGNWLNNPPAVNPDPLDADFNPAYRMVLLEEFAREGFGFLAFSMPGFEPSQGKAGEQSFATACDYFAAFTKNLARKSGIEAQNIIACGESLGGAVATIFAAKMTAKSYPPGVLSLIATFDSLIGMTHNEFPIFEQAELDLLLGEKLDTTKELSHLDKKQTFLHIVAAEDDRVIPLRNTENLLNAARALGFNVLYHPLGGDHTTWDKKAVLDGKKLTHMAREKKIEIAEYQTVKDIKKILGRM